MKNMYAIVAALSLIASPALALDLQDARSQGLVGETQAGYVAKVGGGAEVASLVADVNAKRRAEYERISQENGQSLDVVAKVAAGTIIGGLPSGAKYQKSGGGWATK